MDNNDNNSGALPVATAKDIGKLYEDNFQKIYKFFYYKVRSSDIAEDLTSETFLTFTNLLKEKKEIQKPNSFLVGIAKITFLNYLKLKYKQEIPVANFGEDFEEYIDIYVKETESAKSYEDILMKFLPQIPAKQRQVLTMRFIDRLSLNEIATALEKDMNYVKTTQKRGIASIKQAIETIGINVHQNILEE